MMEDAGLGGMACVVTDVRRSDMRRRSGHCRRADKRRRGERERGGDQQAGYPVNEPHARNLRPKRTLFKSAMRRRG